MPNLFFSALKIIVRLFLRQPRLELVNPLPTGPVVFVANHEGAWGPIMLYYFLPANFSPWVISEITLPGSCHRYLEADFVCRELKLPPPLSGFLARTIEIICLPLMKWLDVIPVFNGNREIISTINKSLHKLKQGHNLLIFPEIAGSSPEAIQKFNPGFINLARIYQRETGRQLPFIPLVVNKKNRTIRIEGSLFYCNNNNHYQEKHKLATAIRDQIRQYY